MRISIKFPCGCDINETAVLAMCLVHDQQLRQRRLEREKFEREIYDRFIDGFNKAIRGDATR